MAPYLNLQSKMIVPNLLVTDDDDPFRSVLCEALGRRGFRVSEACDGQEAIEVIEASQNDESTRLHLALVDVHMPRLSGLDVMRHVRTLPSGPACVLMSAELDEQIREEAIRMEAYQVLAKPIRLSQLRDVVTNALCEVYGWRSS